MNLANVCLHTGKAAKPGRHAESLNRPSMPPVLFRPDPTRTGHQAAGCANCPAFQKAPYAWQTLPASLSRRNFFIPTKLLYPDATRHASGESRASLSARRTPSAFNPNRSSDFGEIARLCHAACFSPGRRRSGPRRGVAGNRMRTEAGKMPECLILPIGNGSGVSHDRFGFNDRSKAMGHASLDMLSILCQDSVFL